MGTGEVTRYLVRIGWTHPDEVNAALLEFRALRLRLGRRLRSG